MAICNSIGNAAACVPARPKPPTLGQLFKWMAAQGVEPNHIQEYVLLRWWGWGNPDMSFTPGMTMSGSIEIEWPGVKLTFKTRPTQLISPPWQKPKKTKRRKK